MKKKLLTGLMAAAIALGMSAETKVTVTPISDDVKQAQTPAKVSSMASELVNENFDEMTEGSITEPYYEVPLASAYGDPNIDPLLTHGEQWQGHKVYSAGGAIAMRTFNPMDPANLETPRMDYSGSVCLTFRARYLNVEWEEENGQKYKWGSSIIIVGLYNDRNLPFDMDDTSYSLAQINIYPNMGWCDVTVEFDNYSAYNDAYINLMCSTGVIIDDVKVTSSIDKFIANPVITGLSDVTETSFTVNFEPVREANNYYGYLFTLDGYDEDGMPIYNYTFPESMIEELESMGMTVADYVAMFSKKDEPYLNSFRTEKYNQHSLTFSDLNPEKEYYYAIGSHYLYTFSDYKANIKSVDVLPTPIPALATGVKDNEFTANWDAVTKAEAYKIDLFGINEVMEDEEYFTIFEEDFTNVSAFTDATDIYDPEWIGYDNGVVIDDLTSSPGWDSSEDEWPLVDGMLGLKWRGAWVSTPSLYVAGADMLRVSLRIEFPSDVEMFIIQFGGIRYGVEVYGDLFEDEIEIPTNGIISAPLLIACADDYDMYIDYLTVTQSLKKGALTSVWLGANEVDAPATSFLFSNLDSEAFDFYGYSVTALRGEGRSRISSLESERVIVDLKNGESNVNAGVVEIESPVEVEEVARYTIDGTLLTAPKKGLNIVRYSDGSVRKEMVK